MDKSAAEKNRITINISDEALLVKEDMIKQNLKALMLAGKEFDEMYASLFTRGAEKFPEVEVKHILKQESCADCAVYTLGEDQENIVIYIHGGAWVMEFDPKYAFFCDELVEKLQAKVYMPLYPLGPQHQYKKSFAMLTELYCQLLEQNKPIFLMGDSSGGHLALGLIHICREKGLRMPEKMILLSPCVDMSYSNPEIDALEAVDPLLARYGCAEMQKLWVADADLAEPLLCPMNCDLTGYPDTMLFVGTHDIFYPDDLLFYHRMLEAGCKVQLVEGKGLWHVFSVNEMPEKLLSIEYIKAFCLA